MMFPNLKNWPVNPHRNEKELPIVVFNRIKDNAKAFLEILISENVPDIISKYDIRILKEYLKKSLF